MKRLFNWLRTLFNKGMDSLEDPAMMLDQARRDMQDALVQNRERAVQAITQKNRLQTMVTEAENKSATIEKHAMAALKQGNRELAKELLVEKAANDQTLETLRGTLVQATETVETVKVAIKTQENEVRKKTAEALAMKAQWKQAEIQSSISKAIEGLTFDHQFESFSSINDKIRNVQSEAAARQELSSSSLQSKVMQSQNLAADLAAETELERLEAQLNRSVGQTELPRDRQAIDMILTDQNSWVPDSKQR